jgi:hypothetical protein
MTIPFDWQAPSLMWFQMWRKALHMAKNDKLNQSQFCRVALQAQTMYVCHMAQEYVEIFKPKRHGRTD